MGRSSNRKAERRLRLGGVEAAPLVSGLRNFESLLDVKYPSWASKLDYFRGMNGREGLPAWPEWCLLPMSATQAVVSDGGKIQSPKVWIPPMQEMAALYAWRQGRGIYCFDEDLAENVLETTGIDELPVETLMHLPEWGVCVIPPKALKWGEEIQAFIAHLEWDTIAKRRELRIVLVLSGKNGIVLQNMQPLHIDSSNIREAVRDSLVASNVFKRQIPDVIELYLPQIRQIVALLIYLGSTKADIVDPLESSKTYNHKEYKVNQDAVGKYEVGFRIGATLRKNLSSQHVTTSSVSAGRQMAPHLRKAHWHHYWTGPKSSAEERQLVVRWIPPTLVGVGELIPTLRNVVG